MAIGDFKTDEEFRTETRLREVFKQAIREILPELVEMIVKEMILEGIVSVSMGENPRLIEEKLLSFLSEKQKNNQPPSEPKR